MADEGKIVGLDGKPVQEQAEYRVNTVSFRGKSYLTRIVDLDATFKVSPKAAFAGVICQNADMTKLLWVGMMALAEDIYTRDPKGSRAFQEFADSVGLVIAPFESEPIEVAQELAKIGAEPVAAETPVNPTA